MNSRNFLIHNLKLHQVKEVYIYLDEIEEYYSKFAADCKHIVKNTLINLNSNTKEMSTPKLYPQVHVGILPIPKLNPTTEPT